MKLNSPLRFFTKLAVKTLSNVPQPSRHLKMLATRNISNTSTASLMLRSSTSSFFTSKAQFHPTKEKEKLLNEWNSLQILRDYTRCDWKMRNLSSEYYLAKLNSYYEAERQLILKLKNLDLTVSTKIDQHNEPSPQEGSSDNFSRGRGPTGC